MDEFEKWLLKNKMSASSAYKYSRAINTISGEMIAEGIIENNLYNLRGICDLDIVINRILSNNKFEIKNNTGHYMYSNALSHFYEYIKSLNDVDILNYKEIALTQEDQSFVEGKAVLLKHIVRERNPQLIRIAKDNFKRKNKKLYCELCKFDFAEKYGELGEDFIEAHHIKPISEMQGVEKTNIEDLIMVCSNCHSMIHRKRPWLNKDELKLILR